MSKRLPPPLLPRGAPPAAKLPARQELRPNLDDGVSLPVVAHRSGTAGRLADTVIEELWFGDEDPIRTHIEASTSLAATTAVVMGLKPFPAIAQRVMRMSQQPLTSATELSEVIERDPGLSARVLSMANSALYAPPRPCTSIANATVRLGIRNIGRIAVALVARGMFDDLEPLGARIRDHCIGVSLLARKLCVGVRELDADEMFLSGLLHDIGKLLATQTKELDYHAMEGDLTRYPEEAHLRERQLVGWDHAVLAAHVIEQWQLPREIATVVAWHHQPGRAYAHGGAIAQAVALLRLADRLEYQLASSRAVDDSFFEELERQSMFEYTPHDAATLRGLWPQLVSSLDEGRSMMQSIKA